MLPSSSSFPPPPPSPTAIALSTTRETTTSGRGAMRMSPSVLIITGIIALVFILSASIHLLLRHISRLRNHNSFLHHHSPSPSTSSTASFHVVLAPDDDRREALISSLPLFILSSSKGPPLSSSADCAVCLSRFNPHEQLRLLPACRHAFHPSCVDTWLRSTPSCPLCRTPVHPPAALPTSGSGSFRVEIGSVSRRGADDPPPLPPHHGTAYSLGSSFEYVVDDEIEAVVAAVAAHVRRRSDDWKENSDAAAATAATPPGEAVAASAGGSGRSWLREYVDRFATSASSSFSSMRLSGRWSRRSDSGGGGVGSWDLERAMPAEEAAAYYSFYRWLVGA